MKQSSYNWARVRFAAILLISLCGVGRIFCQQSLESNFRISGAGVLGIFEPQRQVLQKSSAVIYEGRKEIAYGVVLTEDGYILSKASEVEGISGLSVRVDLEFFKEAKVVLVDTRWDVALIKVDAKGLLPVIYADHSELVQGTWVVVNGATSRTKRRLLAGIISAKMREIPPEGGAVLGVELKEDGKSLEVSKVSAGSGAEEAGILPGDVIVSADGKAVKDINALFEILKEKKEGESMLVGVRRKKEKLELSVRLAARGELFAEENRNDQMSGDVSKRRGGFPRVLQHDVLANSNTMGGPVIGLDGRLIGMNIARANRAETFAIPGEDLKILAEGMVKQARN